MSEKRRRTGKAASDGRHTSSSALSRGDNDGVGVRRREVTRDGSVDDDSGAQRGGRLGFDLTAGTDEDHIGIETFLDDDEEETGGSESLIIDAPDKQPWYIRWISVWIALALVLLTWGVGFVLTAGDSSAEDTAAAKLTGIRQKTVELRQQASSAFRSSMQEKTGLDYSRKSADDKFFADFAELAFSWSDIPHYLAQRDRLISKYKLPMNSTFVREFLPGKKALTIKDPLTGEESLRDPYRSMRFVSSSSVITGASGDWYSYFAIVKVIADSPTTSGSGSEVTAAMTYKVDTVGHVADVNAWPVMTESRSNQDQ